LQFAFFNGVHGLAVKFAFELESLLTWKINLEELAQMRLADRVAALRVQEDTIRCLAESRRTHGEDFRRRQKEGLRPGEYLLYSQFMEGSYRSLQVLEEQKKDLVRAVDEERDRLLIVTREKKILERLKEKKHRAFVTLVAKQEQNVLDERTVLRHPSRSRLPIG
jgi:flagellar protein FliJ